MKKPLEEAPLEVYLEILRQEGYEQEAEESELFYVELLTGVNLGDGKQFTKEQVMKTTFKNLVVAAQTILQQAEREVRGAMVLTSISGKMIAGPGADELSPDELQRLMARQMQLLEEEKLRLAVR